MAEVGDQEQGTPKVDPAEVAPEERASIGVLGWLGFFILNSVAWGMISVASVISWIFGFLVCLVYTTLLIGMALCLERRGQVYKQFVNLLWVLGAWFFFLCGLFIAVNALGGGTDGGSSGGSGGNNGPLPELQTLLPSDASSDLKAWANSASSPDSTFKAFSGNTFFNGRDEDSSDWSQYLYRSDGSSTSLVSPKLIEASSFNLFKSDLYFAARPASSSDKLLFRVSASNLSGATSVPLGLVGSQSYEVRKIFVDSVRSKIFVLADVRCLDSCWGGTRFANTIVSTTGSVAGTVDLRGDTCALFNNTDCANQDRNVSSGKPSWASLWGVLFLAAVPMVVLACVVLFRKKLPGLFVNIFGGIIVIVVTCYLLANYDDDRLEGLTSFMKWFLTSYTSLLWLAIVVLSLRFEDLPPWKEELKSWASAVVAVGFFIMIHVDLEIPVTSAAWRWVVYALLVVLQMLISAAVERAVPMVTGSIGLFILSWKVAYELVALTPLDGSLYMLAMLAIVGLQGVGIIVLAIFYSQKRTEFETYWRSLLTSLFCVGRRKALPL